MFWVIPMQTKRSRLCFILFFIFFRSQSNIAFLVTELFSPRHCGELLSGYWHRNCMKPHPKMSWVVCYLDKQGKMVLGGAGGGVPKEGI